MQNVNVVPTADSGSEIKNALKYKLKNSEGNTKICLIGGLASLNRLAGRVLTDKTFKDVEGNSEITATSLGNIIQHSLDYDLVYPPEIKAVRLKVLSSLNQLEQIEQKLVIETVDRFQSIEQTQEIEAIHESGGVFCFPVNQVMTPNKAMYFQLLSSIEVEIEVVYA